MLSVWSRGNIITMCGKRQCSHEGFTPWCLVQMLLEYGLEPEEIKDLDGGALFEKLREMKLQAKLKVRLASKEPDIVTGATICSSHVSR